MSFFELFNQVFELNARQVIKPGAFKLYMFWLHEFNQARWPEQLYRRANQVYAELGMDKNTFVTAVAQLEARGLLAYEAGKNGKAGEWLLNYEPATESWVAKVKNSPQSKVKNSPQADNSEVKNSPSFHPNEAETFDSRVKNSPPIRNRQNIQEETTTSVCVGEAAEEITHAPLPAKILVSAPRCEAPPLSGSVELPEAVATEAKQLATTIGQLWKISELTNYTKWARIAAFTKRLAQLGQLAQVTQQFAGYKLQREKAGLRPHSLDTWLGTYANDFANGEWCGCDWAAVAADTRTRPGESLSTAAPARAATSPTKARAQNWS
jgi:hypothetical protein